MSTGCRRLDVLEGGPRDLPAPQQALRETMAWSCELLDRGERTLFERLAVLVGSADLAAIQAITNPDGAFACRREVPNVTNVDRSPSGYVAR